MLDIIEKLQKEALEKINSAETKEKLNELKVVYLGKKGELTALLKNMKNIAPEERAEFGKVVNEAREAIENTLNNVGSELAKLALEERLKAETIDVTLPANKREFGHSHPNIIALHEVEKIFTSMGYEVVEGPEIEFDEYNFTKLNIPEDHPAKDEQDTFYITKDIVLRTQTSPVQARTMETGKLPIKMISPGRVYRSDEVLYQRGCRLISCKYEYTEAFLVFKYFFFTCFIVLINNSLKNVSKFICSHNRTIVLALLC